MIAVLPRMAGAAALGFALATPYLSLYTVQRNRYFFHWRQSDVLGVLLIALVLTLIMILADLTVRHASHPVMRRMRNAGFGLVLGVALAANLYQASFTISWIPGTAWYWVLAPLLACVGARWSAVAGRGVVLCAILSPMVVLVPARMLAYPPFDVQVKRVGKFAHSLNGCQSDRRGFGH